MIEAAAEHLRHEKGEARPVIIVPGPRQALRAGLDS